MSEQELMERITAVESGVSLSVIRGSRKVQQFEAEEIYNSLTNELPRLPFYFVDRRGVTAEEIAVTARAFSRSHNGIDLIVIDYLQLLRPENPRDPRHLQVGQSAKIIRNLAGELKCPILCLAQLNRESEQRGGQPRLSDLRDSGEIEQDADVVLLMSRSTTDPRAEIQEIEVHIAKNRNGPTGTIQLDFVRSVTKFASKVVPM